MSQAQLPAATDVAPLVVVEPAAPRRVRRPLDLVRFALSVLGVVVSLLIARFAVNTAYGIGKDLTGVAPLVPTAVLSVFSFLLGLGAVAFPVAVGIDAVLRNRARDVIDGVVAAVAAGLIAWVANVWVRNAAPPQMIAALVRTTSRGLTTPATQPFVAVLIALITVAGVGGRESLQRVMWGLLGAGMFSALVAGVTSPASALLTVSLGRGMGLLTRYALGIPSLRPDGRQVAATLARNGLDLARLDSVDAGDRQARRYLGVTRDGRRLDVHVFDRDQQGMGVLYRFWRRVRLRETVLRRESVSMRQSIERHTLLAYAAQRAGVATPPLLVAAETGPEATVLAYEDWQGVPLADAAPEMLSEEHLASAWAQLGRLRRHAIAHRNLAPSSLVAADNGGVWLRPLGLGEVAASDLQLRLDVAELLCTLGAVVGPERAVSSGIAALGQHELVAAVPLLQPIALSSETRAAVRRKPDLLRELRSRILQDSPPSSVEPVRLERLRPRTLLSILAGAVGGYVLLSQLGQVNVSQLLASAHWGWVGVAVAGSVLTYLASALILIGFAPVPLQLERTVMAQLAASFAALVTPPAVGGVAVNVRFVQRSGATPGLAVASVGVAQAAAFAIHLVLLALAGYLTGSQTGTDLLPARRVLVALAVALVISGLVLLLPVARRIVVHRIRPFLSEVIPRLVDVVQQPKRVALGVAGNLLLNFGYVVALDGAIRAFGGHLPFWSVAVVYLAGSAIGNAAPTPGGLGAVEAALAAGLTAAGLAGDVAVSAVLLYRLATFWLPVAPGYLAFGWLQRRHAL